MIAEPDTHGAKQAEELVLLSFSLKQVANLERQVTSAHHCSLSECVNSILECILRGSRFAPENKDSAGNLTFPPTCFQLPFHMKSAADWRLQVHSYFIW